MRQFERVTGISALYLDWRPTDTLTRATEISRNIGANYDFELGPAALSARFAITNLTDAAYWVVGGYPGYAALSLSASRTL